MKNNKNKGKNMTLNAGGNRQKQGGCCGKKK